MSDRGYQENPDWLLFAQLQAAQQVKANKISEAEAFENLRRKYMLVYQAEKSEPLYWQPYKKKTVKTKS